MREYSKNLNLGKEEDPSKQSLILNHNDSSIINQHALLNSKSKTSYYNNDAVCKTGKDTDVVITSNANQNTTVASGMVRKSIYPFIRKKIRPNKASRKTPPFLDYVPRSRYEKVKHVSLPTAKEIEDNIPSNASSVFHVMDRRIDFDSLREDANCYELLRAWVKDDPCRVPQRRYGNLMDYVELDQDWNVKPKSHVAMHSTTSGSSNNVESDKSSKEVFRVNILDGNYIGQSSVMEMKKYLKDYVVQGKTKKTSMSSELRKRDKMVLKQLQMKMTHLNRKSK